MVDDGHQQEGVQQRVEVRPELKTESAFSVAIFAMSTIFLVPWNHLFD